MKQKTYQAAGRTWYGATKTEAKELARAQIDAFLAAPAGPIVLTHPRYPWIMGMAWAELSGWAYACIRPADSRRPGVAGGDYCYCGTGSRDEALTSLRNAMAQHCMDLTGDGAAGWGLEFLHEERELDSHRAYIGWQRAYKHGRGAGMDDTAARDYAQVNRAQFIPRGEPLPC